MDNNNYIYNNNFNYLESSADSRISRNFEDMICERNENDYQKTIYSDLFDKIREKLFVTTDTDNMEITEEDKITFDLKYKIPESFDVISGLKKNISINLT